MLKQVGRPGLSTEPASLFPPFYPHQLLVVASYETDGYSSSHLTLGKKEKNCNTKCQSSPLFTSVWEIRSSHVHTCMQQIGLSWRNTRFLFLFWWIFDVDSFAQRKSQRWFELKAWPETKVFHAGLKCTSSSYSIFAVHSNLSSS